MGKAGSSTFVFFMHLACIIRLFQIFTGRQDLLIIHGVSDYFRYINRPTFSNLTFTNSLHLSTSHPFDPLTMACVFIFLALVFSMAMAADHSPLQDFCVADMNAQGTMIISLIFLTFITRKSTSNSVGFDVYYITVFL